MVVNDELLDTLDQNLETLTGYDFEEMERAERMLGNSAGEIGATKTFQARLVARALNVPYPEIQALGIKDYARLTAKVFNFLYVGLAKDIIRKNKLEALQ